MPNRVTGAAAAAPTLGRAEAAARVAALLRGAGVREALGSLNARTRFRFTGIRRAGERASVVALFDRENPTVALHGGWDALCLQPLRAGVELRAPDGSVWGILAHFDARPRLLPAGEFQLLASVAPLFASALCRGQPALDARAARQRSGRTSAGA